MAEEGIQTLQRHNQIQIWSASTIPISRPSDVTPPPEAWQLLGPMMAFNTMIYYPFQ